MKYIPGLSIRMPGKVEFGGIDSHEFYNEEVGDWGMTQLQRTMTSSET